MCISFEKWTNWTHLIRFGRFGLLALRVKITLKLNWKQTDRENEDEREEEKKMRQWYMKQAMNWLPKWFCVCVCVWSERTMRKSIINETNQDSTAHSLQNVPKLILCKSWIEIAAINLNYFHILTLKKKINKTTHNKTLIWNSISSDLFGRVMAGLAVWLLFRPAPMLPFDIIL